MKCLVCNNEYDDAQYNHCPKCGFVRLNVIGDLDAQSPDIQEMVKKYVNSKVEGMEIFVKTTQYAAGLNMPPTVTYQSLGKIGEDIKETVTWLPQDYARVDRPEVDITLRLKDIRDNDRELTVTMPVPEGVGFWKLGVAYLGKLHLKLYIFGAGEMTESQIITL